MDIKKTVEDLGEIVIDESRKGSQVREIALAVAEESSKAAINSTDRSVVTIVLGLLPSLLKLIFRLFK